MKFKKQQKCCFFNKQFSVIILYMLYDIENAEELNKQNYNRQDSFKGVCISFGEDSSISVDLSSIKSNLDTDLFNYHFIHFKYAGHDPLDYINNLLSILDYIDNKLSEKQNKVFATDIYIDTFGDKFNNLKKLFKECSNKNYINKYLKFFIKLNLDKLLFNNSSSDIIDSVEFLINYSNGSYSNKMSYFFEFKINTSKIASGYVNKLRDFLCDLSFVPRAENPIYINPDDSDYVSISDAHNQLLIFKALWEYNFYVRLSSNYKDFELQPFQKEELFRLGIKEGSKLYQQACYAGFIGFSTWERAFVNFSTYQKPGEFSVILFDDEKEELIDQTSDKDFSYYKTRNCKGEIKYFKCSVKKESDIDNMVSNTLRIWNSQAANGGYYNYNYSDGYNFYDNFVTPMNSTSHTNIAELTPILQSVYDAAKSTHHSLS